MAETLNLCHLAGYSTGGTIHVVVNNQIGFTTNPQEARSTLYCTDVAKMIQAPILHVNGDDPEAVVHCVKLALAYRQRFSTDVVIDMVCYRRHGHNEGDEPSFTQPLLYEKIRRTKPVRERYTEELLRQGLLRPEDVGAHRGGPPRAAPERARSRSRRACRSPTSPTTRAGRGAPSAHAPAGRRARRPASPSSASRRSPSASAVTPPGFEVHPKLAEAPRPAPQGGRGGRGPRLGDGRGCSPSAACWSKGRRCASRARTAPAAPSTSATPCSSTSATGEEYAPLDHLAATQARFEVYDSQLSEAAVLGFEYGYSLADPTTLDALGGAVRRLRERRPGDHRPVHRRRPREVAAHERARAAAAPRLRGPGPGALERARRALPAALRRGQPPGRELHDARAVLPPAAPPDAPPLPRAARRLHAEEPAARPARRVARRRRSPPAASARCSTTRACRDPAPCGACSSAPARSTTTSLERREERAGAAQRRRADVAIVRLEQLYPWPEEALAAALAPLPAARSACSGCRRSPPTWAPGPSCASASRSCCRRGRASATRAAAASASPAVGSGAHPPPRAGGPRRRGVRRAGLSRRRASLARGRAPASGFSLGQPSAVALARRPLCWSVLALAAGSPSRSGRSRCRLGPGPARAEDARVGVARRRSWSAPSATSTATTSCR